MTLRRTASPARLSRLLLAGALTCAGVAAQTVPAPAAETKPPVKKEEPAPLAPAGLESATVTVSAERPTNRIDRQVYDIKADVGASNGSAADAFNNVPSVAVDPDGTLTLRGSANVTILIDGKPSAMMQGDNRAATLASMPAEDIESIEVINNPGAQFGNEAGGGPILNIIMKRTRKPGGFGAVSANGGSAGRYNAAVSGSYHAGRFGVQGGANVRHDGRNSIAAADRIRTDPLTGIASHSTQESRSTGLNDSAGFNALVTYNLGATDTLGANVAYSRRTNDAQAEDRYVNFGQDDIADSNYLRTTSRTGSGETRSGGARYEHKGEIPGELLKLDLRMSSAGSSSDAAYANAYTVRPAGVRDSRSRQANQADTRIVDFTGDYERPGDQGVLKLGYKLAKNSNEFDVRYTNIDSVTQAESINALRSNRFALDQTTFALYGSYQMRLNESWGVLGGVRAEYTGMEVAQLTSALVSDNNYLNVIPSFFVTYKATDQTNVRLSYAHRIRRPGANDLNPFVVYRDEYNVFSGNPGLKPTETDSIELGIETKTGVLDTNLRAYFRQDTGLISERKVFISDTVLLTTRENTGDNHAGGLEFTVSGKLLPTLTVNTSGNLGYTEQRIYSAVTGLYGMRSATSLTGRARFNVQLSEQDQLQIALNAQGKTLFGQGYRDPNATVNFSLRHAITPMLNVVLNVTDAFNTNKIAISTDTDVLRESNVRRYDGRVIYVGLSYRMGGITPPPGRRPPTRG
jgi:outer membrane receptor protein involved in Fe transport